MIFIQVITIILSGALNSLGGYHYLFCRRYIMPVIIAITISILTHIWWCGLMVLPVIGTLCLGYDFGRGFLGRGLWLALQAFVIGIGVCVTHHLAWYFFVPYVIIAFLLEGSLYSLFQIIGDIVFGCWLSIIVFFVR